MFCPPSPPNLRQAQAKLWGEPEMESPPALGDLGGDQKSLRSQIHTLIQQRPIFLGIQNFTCFLIAVTKNVS